MVYEVNGRCTCPDYAFNRPPGGWCKHRLTRALAKRTAEILRNENGAGGEEGTPAPDSMGTTMKLANNCSTDPSEGQVKRIDLILAFEADEMKVLPQTNLFLNQTRSEDKSLPAPYWPRMHIHSLAVSQNLDWW